MPFARPTLTTLRQRIRSALVSLAGPLLRFSNLGILGDVQAGEINGLYGYLDWIARQSVPFTCTDEFLEAWAAFKAVARKAAEPAGADGSSLAQFSGMAGTLIPAGASVVRLLDGFEYATLADATIAAGATTVNVAIQATAAGAGGNCPAGTVLVLGSAVAGVQSSGSAYTPITGGADLELDDALRTRMLQAFAAPAQGGAFSDYVEWAQDVAGVTRAWVKPGGMGTGSVLVYVMMDEAEAANGGFPQGVSGVATAETRTAPRATGDLLAVANALFPVQPATPLVYAVAPLDNAVAFTIAGLAGASSATRAAVQAAIAQVLLEQGSPGGVLLPDLTTGGKVDVSYIEAAIAAVPGATGFVITAIQPSNGSAVPGAAGNIISAAGYLPTLGAVTWA